MDWIEIDCTTREHILDTLFRINPPRLRRVSRVERWPLEQTTWAFVGERDEILVEESVLGRTSGVVCRHWLTEVGAVRLSSVLRQVAV